MIDATMDLFVRISIHRMIDHHLPKIRQCMDALNTQQLWEHEVNQANSVGGILFHVCEQVDRHTAEYQQAGKVSMGGIEDYFPDMGMSSKELLQRVEKTFSVWQRTIQEFLEDPSKEVDIHRIYHLIEHTSYHLGQVVDRIQTKTGIAFQFAQHGINERNLRTIIERDTTAPR
ncbi:MAG: hypothetical protein ACYCVB_13195 [Bacilli bacterium]